MKIGIEEYIRLKDCETRIGILRKWAEDGDYIITSDLLEVLGMPKEQAVKEEENAKGV